VRVFFVLEIYLSEVEHVRSECLWFETLLPEFLFIGLNYFQTLIVKGALDMLCITDLDVYWLLRFLISY
jgi:hypothetical protein